MEEDNSTQAAMSFTEEASKASLLRLPNEILHQICFQASVAKAKKKRESDEDSPYLEKAPLASLCRTSRVFHEIGTPYLYQDIFASTRKLPRLARTLMKSPILARHVRVIMFELVYALARPPTPEEAKTYRRLMLSAKSEADGLGYDTQTVRFHLGLAIHSVAKTSNLESLTLVIDLPFCWKSAWFVYRPLPFLKRLRIQGIDSEPQNVMRCPILWIGGSESRSLSLLAPNLTTLELDNLFLGSTLLLKPRNSKTLKLTRRGFNFTKTESFNWHGISHLILDEQAILRHGTRKIIQACQKLTNISCHLDWSCVLEPALYQSEVDTWNKMVENSDDECCELYMDNLRDLLQQRKTTLQSITLNHNIKVLPDQTEGSCLIEFREFTKLQHLRIPASMITGNTHHLDDTIPLPKPIRTLDILDDHDATFRMLLFYAKEEQGGITGCPSLEELTIRFPFDGPVPPLMTDNILKGHSSEAEMKELAKLCQNAGITYSVVWTEVL